MFKKKKKQNKEDDLYGFLIPGGILIGMGVGFLTDNLIGWMFVGLGAGFLLAAIVGLFKK